MFKTNLDKLHPFDREHVEKYQKERRKTFFKITSIFAAAAIIANGAVFALGTHRIPFTRGTREIQLYTKDHVTYISGRPPLIEPFTFTEAEKESEFFFDQVAYIGAASMFSENTPEVKMREFTEPVNIPSQFIQGVDDRDKLYSKIVHDPDFMAGVLELSTATTSTQTIVGVNADDPVLHEPSRFVITSWQPSDSLETTRVPDGTLAHVQVSMFEILSILAYPLAFKYFWWQTYGTKGIINKKAYRRYMKEAKGK